jgi:hypothetical protein
MYVQIFIHYLFEKPNKKFEEREREKTTKGPVGWSSRTGSTAGAEIISLYTCKSDLAKFRSTRP